MPSQSDLRAAIERLLARAADEDRRLLQHALLAGEITSASGAGSVAIGGSVSDSTVVTGDHNQFIQFDLGQFTYDQFRELIFPKPPGLVPPFPDLLFIGREAAMADVKALLEMKPGASSQSHRAVVRGSLFTD